MTPSYFLFFHVPATTEIYTLSLHDALPISRSERLRCLGVDCPPELTQTVMRSEEHTSELQSHSDLVCRLLLEKKKNKEKIVLLRSKATRYSIYVRKELGLGLIRHKGRRRQL